MLQTVMVRTAAKALLLHHWPVEFKAKKMGWRGHQVTRGCMPRVKKNTPVRVYKRSGTGEIHMTGSLFLLASVVLAISVASHAAFSWSMTSLVGNGFLTLVSACFSLEGSKDSIP